MLAIILAVITFVCWGSSDIFAAKLSRRSGALTSSFLAYVFSLLPLLLIIPYGPGHLTPVSLVISVALGVLLAACWIGFNEAFRLGSPSIVVVITGAFVFLVVLFSVIFLKESLNVWQMLFIAPIILGIILTSLNINDIKAHGWKINRSIWLSLAVMIGWGVYYTFIKIPIQISDWYWPNLIVIGVGALIFLGMSLNNISATLKKANLKLGFVVGITSIIGTIAFSLALQAGKSAVVAPIAGSYPILFVLLAGIVFKEKINLSQKIGVVMTLAGIVGLAVVSG